ncbi:DNA repair protein RecO [candidate division WOR-3 bacterium]|nr:DNA repair protein RecO [candidate division WOR-3 bacterium]MCK4576701.1 DNA repair protein RecO [candidate division WOR-3 bacterium]
MKERIKKTQVIVLKGMDYRETSRIITAFSEGFGKIKLIAKGVRNPKSRMSAALQSFVNSEIVFYKKETRELHLVREAEMVEYFGGIHNDLLRFNYASVVADFLSSLLATEQVSKTLYQYSLFTLHRIDKRKKKYLPFTLVSFLLKGADLLGFRIELEKCKVCEKKSSLPLYFSNEKGGIVCEVCRMADSAAVEINKSVYHFMKTVQQQKEDGNYKEIETEDFRKVFLLLSNWFNYHSHGTLKTLDIFIKGKPFNLYNTDRKTVPNLQG